MLVLAIIDVESKFQFACVSPAGARGMMQILPDVAKAVAEEMGPEKYFGAGQFQPEHLDNPLLNIKLGLYYLHHLKKNFHSLNLALVAYNAGPTEIRNCLENNTEISEEYASTVLAAYHKYKMVNHPAF
jgi:soluble lytic murein transglycosylase